MRVGAGAYAVFIAPLKDETGGRLNKGAAMMKPKESNRGDTVEVFLFGFFHSNTQRVGNV